MLPRSLLLISVLLLSAAQLCSAAQDRQTFYYNIAEGNYLIGDISGAERGVEQSLRLDPTHAPSHALLAKIRLDQSQPEAALKAAEQAIESAPQQLEYQVLKALILGNLGRRAAAITLLDAILEKAEPTSQAARTAQHLKGLFKMAVGEWDAAAAAFKRSYQPATETSSTGRQLASEAYLEKARTAPDLPAALAAIDQAIALYADATGRENLQKLERLKLTRAKLLAQGGRSAEAIQALQRLAGRNPDNLEAIVTLASLYASREEWLALEDLIAPIASNPQLTDVALYLEGRVALARDRVGTARAKFEAALQQNAERPTALQHALEFYRSICFEKLERRDQAEQALQQAMAGGYLPETPAEAIHLGRLYLRIGEVDTLIPLLERALLGGNASPEGWTILGRAHLKKEQHTLAISALNQSLLLDPDQPATLALRGSELRRIGDLTGALADYQRALRLAPASPVLSYEQGLVLLQLGRIEAAEPLLRTAARKLITHPTLDLLHASCAYALGQYAMAAESLREYLCPQLTGDALEQFKAKLSDTAAYLHILLASQPGTELPKLPTTSQAAHLFAEYTTGQATRKQVLDWAGRAETPARARAQICSAAFWLAQYERSTDNAQAYQELLKIALDAGQPENPEWQFTRWQLARIPQS